MEMIAECQISTTYASACISINCECGERIYLDEWLFNLWKARGIRFRCICNRWIEYK